MNLVQTRKIFLNKKYILKTECCPPVRSKFATQTTQAVCFSSRFRLLASKHRISTLSFFCKTYDDKGLFVLLQELQQIAICAELQDQQRTCGVLDTSQHTNNMRVEFQRLHEVDLLKQTLTCQAKFVFEARPAETRCVPPRRSRQATILPQSHSHEI